MITELSRKVLLQRDPETAHPFAIVELRLFLSGTTYYLALWFGRGTG